MRERHFIRKTLFISSNCILLKVNIQINGWKLPSPRIKSLLIAKQVHSYVFVFYTEIGFDILAVCHHLLGDGNAIARLLRDVVFVYAGNNLPLKEQQLISKQSDFPQKLNFLFL